MIQFTDEAALKKWFQERRYETNARRLAQQEYAAKSRSYDAGVQWLTGGSSGSAFDSAAIRLYKQAGSANVPDGGTAPLRTTLNKITENVRRIQASTNPRKLDVHSTPSAGIGQPGDVVQGDIVEAMANSVIEASGALSVTKRANFERCIDGMHGFGYRIERNEHPSGQLDMRLQAFNYDGFQLTLDPTNCDANLYNHEYVIYSEVMTLHAAKRMYGDSQIDKLGTEDFREVGQLMPVERKFHSLTGGLLFPEMASQSKSKGLVVHTIFLRGTGKRFDRMYTIIDKVGNKHSRDNGQTLIVTNFEVNTQPNGGNPYGGIGMPFFCLFGYPRSKDLHGISDVAMMIDAQDKLNIAASIYFQSLWNYVQKVVYVDRRSLDDSKTKTTDIMRQMRNGIVMMNMRDRNAHMPVMQQNPQPPQSVSNDIAQFKSDVRDSGFRSASQSGETKSHVADATVERSIEQSEIAADDRVDSDIREYEKFIESLVSTEIRLAQAGSISSQRLMFESGMSEEQVGMMLRIDPFRQLPRIKLSEESVRRRSRSQQKADINLLAGAGVFTNDPAEMRRLFTSLDMPVSKHDKTLEQYAEITAAKVALTGDFQPFPMGSSAVYLIEALQRTASQVTDPQVRQRIIQAMFQQQEIENQASAAGQQQGAEQPSEEANLQDIVNTAFNPDAAV